MRKILGLGGNSKQEQNAAEVQKRRSATLAMKRHHSQQDISQVPVSSEIAGILTMKVSDRQTSSVQEVPAQRPPQKLKRKRSLIQIGGIKPAQQNASSLIEPLPITPFYSAKSSKIFNERLDDAFLIVNLTPYNFRRAKQLYPIENIQHLLSSFFIFYQHIVHGDGKILFYGPTSLQQFVIAALHYYMYGSPEHFILVENPSIKRYLLFFQHVLTIHISDANSSKLQSLEFSVDKLNVNRLGELSLESSSDAEASLSANGSTREKGNIALDSTLTKYYDVAQSNAHSHEFFFTISQHGSDIWTGKPLKEVPQMDNSSKFIILDTDKEHTMSWMIGDYQVSLYMKLIKKNGSTAFQRIFGYTFNTLLSLKYDQKENYHFSSELVRYTTKIVLNKKQLELDPLALNLLKDDFVLKLNFFREHSPNASMSRDEIAYLHDLERLISQAPHSFIKDHELLKNVRIGHVPVSHRNVMDELNEEFLTFFKNSAYNRIKLSTSSSSIGGEEDRILRRAKSVDDLDEWKRAVIQIKPSDDDLDALVESRESSPRSSAASDTGHIFPEDEERRPPSPPVSPIAKTPRVDDDEPQGIVVPPTLTVDTGSPDISLESKVKSPPPPPPIPRDLFGSSASPVGRGGPPPPPPPLPFGGFTGGPPPPPPLFILPGGPGGPPPPPPPPGGLGAGLASPPPMLMKSVKKLKRFHWKPVRVLAQNSFWKQREKDIKSIALDTEQIETLFSNETLPKAKLLKSPSAIASPKSPAVGSISILSGTRIQNVEIMLKQFKGIDRLEDSLFNILSNLQSDALTETQLSSLKKIIPTEDERQALLKYTGDPAKLNFANRFMRTLCSSFRWQEKIDTLIYMKDFNASVMRLRQYLKTKIQAYKQIKSSAHLTRFLEQAVVMGNTLNRDSHRLTNASGFMLADLPKFQQVKGVDKKTSVMHFIAETLFDEGYALIDLKSELNAVESAAEIEQGMIDRLSGEISSMLLHFKSESKNSLHENHTYQKKVEEFLQHADSQVQRLKRLLQKRHTEFKNLLEFYCDPLAQRFSGTDDQSDLDDSQFLSVIHDFVALYEKCWKDNEERRKKERSGKSK